MSRTIARTLFGQLTRGLQLLWWLRSGAAQAALSLSERCRGYLVRARSQASLSLPQLRVAIKTSRTNKHFAELRLIHRERKWVVRRQRWAPWLESRPEKKKVQRQMVGLAHKKAGPPFRLLVVSLLLIALCLLVLVLVLVLVLLLLLVVVVAYIYIYRERESYVCIHMFIPGPGQAADVAARALALEGAGPAEG